MTRLPIDHLDGPVYLGGADVADGIAVASLMRFISLSSWVTRGGMALPVKMFWDQMARMAAGLFPITLA
jgi:hypothetical protein